MSRCLWAAAEGFRPLQTRLRASSGCNTALSYADSDAAVDSSSDRIDALQERAVVDAASERRHGCRKSAAAANIEDIVVMIDGVDVDVAVAREHPGGAAVLRRFHGKDASKAFHAAKHSKAALDRMRALQPEASEAGLARVQALHARGPVASPQGARAVVPGPLRRPHPPRDLVGGPGGRAEWLSAVPWLLPHALLSLSSIKFPVPRERIAKKPMIWQEFRMHNIIFALRSVCVCGARGRVVARFYDHEAARCGRRGVYGRVATCVIDRGRRRTPPDQAAGGRVETTTETMPYWAGASPSTIRRFKGFYAYCQWMATLGLFGQRQPALAALHRAADPARVAADDAGAQGPADGARLPPPLHGVALRAVRRRWCFRPSSIRVFVDGVRTVRHAVNISGGRALA